MKWYHWLLVALMFSYTGIARWCDFKDSLGFECEHRCTERRPPIFVFTGEDK